MGYNMHAAHQMMMQQHYMQQQHHMGAAGGDGSSFATGSGRSDGDSQSFTSASGRSDGDSQSDRSGSAAGAAPSPMQRHASQQYHMGAASGRPAGPPAAVSMPQQQQTINADYNARAHEDVEIKSGWLFKKAESSWGWRKRWFVLYKSRLAYFSSPDARGVVKTIALNDPRVETVVEALPHELEFRINSYGRSFHLKAVSDGERAQWIFALQLVIKDGLIAHEKYAELARKQQLRKSSASADGAAAGGAVLGGYANIVSGGSNAGSSGRGGGSADSSRRSSSYQQQALGMFSATQLKRKLAEALPADALKGAPTPALALSNPGSREGSMHGSRDGSFRGSRSADVSQHNYLADAHTSGGAGGGRRSRDGSMRGGEDYSGPGPDDSGGKRVRKDGETLSKTLSVAGQQAVELTMRYLAHVLLRGEGPFQVLKLRVLCFLL